MDSNSLGGSAPNEIAVSHVPTLGSTNDNPIGTIGHAGESADVKCPITPFDAKTLCDDRQLRGRPRTSDRNSDQCLNSTSMGSNSLVDAAPNENDESHAPTLGETSHNPIGRIGYLGESIDVKPAITPFDAQTLCDGRRLRRRPGTSDQNCGQSVNGTYTGSNSLSTLASHEGVAVSARVYVLEQGDDRDLLGNDRRRLTSNVAHVARHLACGDTGGDACTDAVPVPWHDENHAVARVFPEILNNGTKVEQWKERRRVTRSGQRQMKFCQCMTICMSLGHHGTP